MGKKIGRQFSEHHFFIALVIITIFFFYIIQPFFFAIFWAVLIAGIFFPLYRFLNRKIKTQYLCRRDTFGDLAVFNHSPRLPD